MSLSGLDKIAFGIVGFGALIMCNDYLVVRKIEELNRTRSNDLPTAPASANPQVCK